MRPTASILRVAVCLSSLAPLTAAWPSWLPDVDALVVRQDDQPSDTSASAPQTTGDATTTGDSASQTGDSTNTADSSDATGDPTDTDDGGDSLNTAEAPSGSESPRPTTQSININDPAGGVSMLEPATTLAATPLWKIGEYATMSWNYTSLQAEPSAIDVLISCSAATETWTLTANMSFETNVEYVWNTNDEANDVEKPLLTELYTLIIKDVEAEISDIADPGHLGAYSQFTFGLYQPAEYTPLSEWECTACNAAIPGFDRQAVGFAFTMSTLTVLTFTWYVVGLGIN